MTDQMEGCETDGAKMELDQLSPYALHKFSWVRRIKLCFTHLESLLFLSYVGPKTALHFLSARNATVLTLGRPIPCTADTSSSKQCQDFLSTHADRQGVDISVTLCWCNYVCLSVCLFLCVCTVTDFSAEDKASGVKFCTAVYRRQRQGISHFCELCSPKIPKSDESASARIISVVAICIAVGSG